MSVPEAFFITPIGEENSKERKRADALLEHVLEPVLGSAFKITRADKIDSPGSINIDIIQRIYNAPLVIADLTGFNPNVMYEVGVRHSFNKPIVQLAQTGQKLPFDISTERTIFFDIGDLDKVSEAKKKIRAATKEAMSADGYVGPIHRALNVSAVAKEESDVSEAIETLSEQVESLGDNFWELTQTRQYSNDISHQVDWLCDLFQGLTNYEVDQIRRLLKAKEKAGEL